MTIKATTDMPQDRGGIHKKIVKHGEHAGRRRRCTVSHILGCLPGMIYNMYQGIGSEVRVPGAKMQEPCCQAAAALRWIHPLFSCTLTRVRKTARRLL